MRGDETQRGVAPGAESRVVKGPRHAAPRKSLLNKIQIPVGKTMALAAMPTAVFVGMGMAPKLAVADDKEIPFAPGPCVTRSDEPAETESKSPSPTPTPSTTPSPSTSPSATPSPSASASAAAKEKAKPTTSPSAAKPPVTNEKAPATTPAPDPTKATNPLDPLGVGDALKNLVDELGRPLKDATAKATPTPAPTPSGTATAAPTPDPSADAIREAAKKAGVDVKELSEEVKKTEKDPKNETGEDKAKDEAKDDKSKAEDDKSKDKDKAEEPKDPDGKQPFPCPTYDAKALADAELEQGVPLLPDEPWYLDSSLLTLYGLDYHGIVEVKTAGGKTKKVLKFTADSLDIKDLYQTVGKSGNVAHLKSRPGSTSKIRGGTVTMYTESLKGNLFGLIPIEFTPNSPPPLNVPFAFFTNVKVVQAGQFGGTLTVPGLKNYIGPPE
ncbi:hypothetical protein Snoj_02130 [Streptomyces nojiriensis]|uniref:Hydrogenase expression protein HypF n=1 Tax=Streptomyces nojiriensis TaxID=66374 RepID=A0ABQ3SDV3_9ACTN|nr:hypothetical protein [Streptomyces nojiriensis]QTI47947.1 hypothetical protein JYK04_05802 [Streptomyces nojiriensis]GGS14568.1 hypothetical protein GCM10010205_50480 [Streptomyces nojiriensis]GHI66295.1 hypothetical protein Snoj_02130 [Streptomyces nojiriensis]